VVHFLNADRVARLVSHLEVRHEVPFEVIAVDEGVKRVAVGVDRSDADGSVIVAQRVGFVGGLRTAANGFRKGPIDVVHFERDVLHEVAVLRDLVGHRVPGPDRGGKQQLDVVLF